MSSKPLSSKVKEQIAKLLPMLSSDQSGEIIAAVTAIRRVLTNNGHDIHDLVDAFVVGTATPRQQQKRRPDFEPDEPGMWRSPELQIVIGSILDSNCRSLTPNARDFLSKLIMRTERYDIVRLTPRQQQWILDLMRDAGIGE